MVLFQSAMPTVPTRVSPGDTALALAVTFLELKPWVAEGMKCIPGVASQRRPQNEGTKGVAQRRSIAELMCNKRHNVTRVQCSGCCAALVNLVLFGPGTVHCGGGEVLLLAGARLAGDRIGCTLGYTCDLGAFP